MAVAIHRVSGMYTEMLELCSLCSLSEFICWSNCIRPIQIQYLSLSSCIRTILHNLVSGKVIGLVTMINSRLLCHFSLFSTATFLPSSTGVHLTKEGLKDAAWPFVLPARGVEHSVQTLIVLLI